MGIGITEDEADSREEVALAGAVASHNHIVLWRKGLNYSLFFVAVFTSDCPIPDVHEVNASVDAKGLDKTYLLKPWMIICLICMAAGRASAALMLTTTTFVKSRTVSDGASEEDRFKIGCERTHGVWRIGSEDTTRPKSSGRVSTLVFAQAAKIEGLGGSTSLFNFLYLDNYLFGAVINREFLFACNSARCGLKIPH